MSRITAFTRAIPEISKLHQWKMETTSVISHAQVIKQHWITASNTGGLSDLHFQFGVSNSRVGRNNRQNVHLICKCSRVDFCHLYSISVGTYTLTCTIHSKKKYLLITLCSASWGGVVFNSIKWLGAGEIHSKLTNLGSKHEKIGCRSTILG